MQAAHPLTPRTAGHALVVQALGRLMPHSTDYTNGAGNFSGLLHRHHRYAGTQHLLHADRAVGAVVDDDAAP